MFASVHIRSLSEKIQKGGFGPRRTSIYLLVKAQFEVTDLTLLILSGGYALLALLYYCTRGALALRHALFPKSWRSCIFSTQSGHQCIATRATRATACEQPVGGGGA